MIRNVIKAFMLTVAVTVGTVVVLSVLTLAVMVSVLLIASSTHLGP